VTFLGTGQSITAVDELSVSSVARVFAPAVPEYDCSSVPPPVNPDIAEPSSYSTAYPKVCRNREQFEAWQKSRKWLCYNYVSGGVKCSSCSEVKFLALHAGPGQHNETAFIDGTAKGKDAKTLLKKIDKHRDSNAHHKCEEILAERENERIVNAVKNAETRFVERNKENIDATAKVFRTAYECAKSHLMSTEHARL